MLMGMIDERRRRYLKVRTIDYPKVPYDPLRMVMMMERHSRTVNKNLLKKFNYTSSCPNLLPASFELRDSFVYEPTYVTIASPLPEATLTPRQRVCSRPIPTAS